MGDLIPINERIKVFDRDGQQWTTSLNIAEVFGKDHAKVLRDIENLDCSDGFSQANFGLSDWTNSRGKTYPMYELTKDGFSFLVMGYTGSNAARFKEDYIRAFNLAIDHIKTEAKLNIRDSVLFEKFLQRMDERDERYLALSQSLFDNLTMVDNKVGVFGTELTVVKEDLTNVKNDVSYIKKHISTKRRKVSKQNRELHVACIFHQYDGLCPQCEQNMIVGPGMSQLKELQFDHHRGRHENALDKTWPLCAECNNKKSNGGISDVEVEVFFNAYQMRLARWRSSNSPEQLGLFSAVAK
jgi:Rha family phage regulatory protein